MDSNKLRMADKIEVVSISELKPFKKNPKLHPDTQVNNIAASMIEFGVTNPILVDAELNVIAGHGRLLALKKLGQTNVPIIRLNYLSPDQARALVVADNKLNESEWDRELLSDLVDEIAESDFDIGILGFTPYELDALTVDPESSSFGQPINNPTQPGGEPFIPDGSSDRGKNRGSPIIQYNIIFDDEDQQQEWFGFMKRLKEIYPDVETFGERLKLFLQSNHYGES